MNAKKQRSKTLWRAGQVTLLFAMLSGCRSWWPADMPRSSYGSSSECRYESHRCGYGSTFYSTPSGSGIVTHTPGAVTVRPY